MEKLNLLKEKKLFSLWALKSLIKLFLVLKFETNLFQQKVTTIALYSICN